jgi:copper chaperone CopZ
MRKRFSELIAEQKVCRNEIKEAVKKMNSTVKDIDSSIEKLQAQYDALTPEQKIDDKFGDGTLAKYQKEIDDYNTLSPKQKKQYALEHVCRGCWGNMEDECPYRKKLDGAPYIDLEKTVIGYKGCKHREWD